MEALLDRDDAIVAIVLGAAAEDVFQGLLRLAGKEAMGARAQFIPHIRAFVALDNPSEPPMPDGVGHSLLRSTSNWLRHNDQDDDAQERTLDFHLEASAVVERAAENAFALTGVDHPRMTELMTRARLRS